MPRCEIAQCRDLDGACPGCAPGHTMHWVHAHYLGRGPWGGRAAVITEVEGRRLTAVYVGEAGRVVAWHHHALDALRPGSPVRLHEERSRSRGTVRVVQRRAH